MGEDAGKWHSSDTCHYQWVFQGQFCGRKDLINHREVVEIDVFNAEEEQAHLTHQYPWNYMKSLVAKRLDDYLAYNWEQTKDFSMKWETKWFKTKGSSLQVSTIRNIQETRGTHVWNWCQCFFWNPLCPVWSSSLHAA